MDIPIFNALGVRNYPLFYFLVHQLNLFEKLIVLAQNDQQIPGVLTSMLLNIIEGLCILQYAADVRSISRPSASSLYPCDKIVQPIFFHMLFIKISSQQVPVCTSHIVHDYADLLV